MPKRAREEPVQGGNSWAEADDRAKVRHMAKALRNNSAQFEHQAHLGDDLVEVCLLFPVCAACMLYVCVCVSGSAFLDVETGSRSAQAATCKDARN